MQEFRAFERTQPRVETRPREQISLIASIYALGVRILEDLTRLLTFDLRRPPVSVHLPAAAVRDDNFFDSDDDVHVS